MKIAVAGATGRVGRHTAEVLAERGHEVVPIARSAGVDVITGDGLAAALDGVTGIVDAATGPSAEQQPATEFFTTAAGNLQRAGAQAGVQRLVVVSIIGTDRFTGGYGAAKMAHEHVALSGPVPARVLRAAQFHEFVPQLVEWGTQGEVSYVPQMRIQPVAAKTVGEALADLVTSPDWAPDPAGGPFAEVAGPREENLVALASLLVARRGRQLNIEGVSDPADPDGAVYTSGSLLPGPRAIIGGPTFEEWLSAAS
ncbi:MAG TPA: NAD(P)H-binding protein [Streptosporangiaceae bacterium]|jgi:uncharacterized protein YbjT (DUF2867 family)